MARVHLSILALVALLIGCDGARRESSDATPGARGGVSNVRQLPTAIARNPDQLDLFITGNDGRVYTSWWHQGGVWSGINDNWASIGGFFPVGAPIAALARIPDHLDLFITGNDGRVYTSWWHQGSDWSGSKDNWSPIGGFFPKWKG